MKYILVILFLFCSLISFGQDVNYYVSNSTGDDASADPTNIATPWKTLAKVNSFNFSPLDSIFFKRGDTWKEYLSPGGNGVAETGALNQHIVFTAYGTGPKPIFTARDTVDGYDVVGNWTRPWPITHPNVWYNREINSADPAVPRMWFDGVEQQVSYTTATNPDAIAFPPNASQKYYWYADDSLFVYCTQNPALEYTGDGIEESQARRYCIYLLNDRYMTFKNLSLQYGYIGVASVNADPIIIDSCDISSAYGMTFSNGATNNGAIFNEDVIIKNCYFNTGSVTTGYSYNPLYTWDGIQINGGCRDFQIYNNHIQDYGHASLNLKNFGTETNERIDTILFYDNYCTSPNQDYGGRLDINYINGSGNKFYRNIFYDLSISSQIQGEKLEFYYNIFNTVKASVYNPNEAYGMIISGPYTTTKPNNIKIYNNVFANCVDEGLFINDYAGSGRQGKHNIDVINNIFYNCDYNIRVANSDSIYDNNFKNNIIYKSGSSTPIYYRGTAMSVATFNSADAKQDTISDNNGDSPQFKSGTFELSALSTNAINQGLDVGQTTDYKQQPLIGLPDIGAYEYYYDVTITGPFVFGRDSTSTGVKFLKSSTGRLLKIIK